MLLFHNATVKLHLFVNPPCFLCRHICNMKICCTSPDLAMVSFFKHYVNISCPCQPVGSPQNDNAYESVTNPIETLFCFVVFTVCSLPGRPTALKWPSAAMIAGTVQVQAPILVHGSSPTLPLCVALISHVSFLLFLVPLLVALSLLLSYQLSDICSFSVSRLLPLETCFEL